MSSRYTHRRRSRPLTVDSYLTPEELLANPDLLTHKAQHPSVKITAFDGLVGAIVNGGHNFITSPNTRWIPEPVLRRCDVFRDVKYRFGIHDPMLWPQEFDEKYCHFSVFMEVPSDENDPYRLFWWEPLEQYFIAEQADGKGKLRGDILDQFSNHVKVIDVRVSNHQRQLKEPNRSVADLASDLRRTMSFLEQFYMTYKQMRCALANLQRCFLELMAVLDWLEIWRPALNGTRKPPTSLPAVVGTFLTGTNGHKVAQAMFDAGIPIWIIWNFRDLRDVRVDSRVEVMRASSVWDIEPLPHTKPIYTERPYYSSSKQAAIRNAYYNYLDLKNPFVHAGDPLPISSLPVRRRVELPKESRRGSRLYHQRYDPYPLPEKDTTTQSTTQRDKFAEPQSPFCPPTTSFWSDALRLVDRGQRLPLNDRLKSGYIFPEVGFILGEATVERTRDYLQTWLLYRTKLIQRVTDNPHRAQPLDTQQWADFLSPLSTETEGEEGESALIQRQNEVKEILDLRRGPEETRLRWCGKDVTEIDEDLGRQLVWEIVELNFRYELVALDRYRSGIGMEDKTRLVEVYKCFPPPASLHECDIKNASTGLAAISQRERAPYIIALRHLMENWPEGKPLREVVHRPADLFSEEELDTLEAAVAQIYSQTFYNHFGRPPTIPRRIW